MFKPKEKEPKLSKDIQNIINGSIEKGTSDCMDEIFRYKYKIMHTLLSNQDILHALHWDKARFNDDGDIINGDQFKDSCVFDFLKLPDLKSEVKNYICFEINDRSGYEATMMKNIIFRVVSHEDDFKTDWNISRQDLLASIVKNEFDWTNIFGMTIEKISDEGNITNDGYCYREIVYRCIALNDPKNKVNFRF